MKKDYKESVDFVFEKNPELAKIGTEKDYSEYLKTIFPETKVKEIVYHGSSNIFNEFKRNYSQYSGRLKSNVGFYFTGDKLLGEKYKSSAEEERKTQGKVYPVILNIKNPIETDSFSVIWKLKEKPKNEDGIIKYEWDQNRHQSTGLKEEIVVFNPKQIHILGSKCDAKKFKEYIKHKNKGNSLENKIVSGLFILSIIFGVFLTAFNLTGNVVGASETTHNFVGIILFLLGLSGFFIYKKLRS